MSKMREECKHGSLRRSCEICDMEGLLKSSEEEMLFWRHAFRDVNAAQIAAEERVEELEAEIEKLKAEQIDMLLHPEKYFSIYRDIKTVFKRAERLEAENAALKVERDALKDWKESALEVERSWDVQKLAKEMGLGLGEPIRAQIAPYIKSLKAELNHAVSINNPCHHTGLESFICEVCGYPDPKKVIAALRTERDRMKAALMDIASAGCNEACEWLENDCDKCMLETAQQALRGEVIL